MAKDGDWDRGFNLIIPLVFDLLLLFLSNPVHCEIPDITTARIPNRYIEIISNSSSRIVPVSLEGKYFNLNMNVGLSTLHKPLGDTCDPQFTLQQLYVMSDSSAVIFVDLTNISHYNHKHFLPNSKLGLYLCVKESEFLSNISLSVIDSSNNSDISTSWIHQRESAEVETVPSSIDIGIENVCAFITNVRWKASDESKNMLQRSRRQANSTGTRYMYGLTVASPLDKLEYSSDGSPVLICEEEYEIRIFGSMLTQDMAVKFTSVSAKDGAICDTEGTTTFEVTEIQGGTTAIVKVTLPKPGGKKYYACLRDSNKGSFHLQGGDPWLQLESNEKLLKLWMQIIILAILLFLSGLFSGLNLGLMSLDRTELKIVMNTGTDTEKKYARTIEPVRRNGNYLLCTLLLGNVLVNSTLTILMDDISSGVVAIIASTLGIVVFGEIIPQALCSRHALAVGARTVYITKLFMIVTLPLSYPISLLLDKILGEEIGAVYNRNRLKELLQVTQDYHGLETEEVNIISGALELRNKTAIDVMTRIEDVYMLSMEETLDFHTVSEIMNQGYSRIPVFEGAHTNIVSLLHIKNLAFVDPEDNTPLKTLCEFYHNPYFFVFEDTKLDHMFRQFKEGNDGHLAFVQHVNSEGPGDPFYEIVGLVTLEDVIEELIQSEIVDETDIWLDNTRSTKRVLAPHMKVDYRSFADEQSNNTSVFISPQLLYATIQYLSTALAPFNENKISQNRLKQLLRMNSFVSIKLKKDAPNQDPRAIIYEQGKPSDLFILIIEGRVEVTVGKEKMVFESGPFTYFGTAILNTNTSAQSPASPESTSAPANKIPAPASKTPAPASKTPVPVPGPGTFTPDYTVRCVTDVVYLRVTHSTYLDAFTYSEIERTQRNKPDGGNDSNKDSSRRTSATLGNDIPSRRPSALKSRTPSMNNEFVVSPMGRRISRVESKDDQMIGSFVTTVSSPSGSTNQSPTTENIINEEESSLLTDKQIPNSNS